MIWKMIAGRGRGQMSVIERMSQNKYFVLGLLFFAWVLISADKAGMNVAIIVIGRELSLSSQSMGIIISAFFLSYSAMTLLGGIMADRFGHRKVLITIMFIWVIFEGLTGLAWSFTSILVIRFVFGASEGGYAPANSITIAELFPIEQRGRAKALLVSSTMVGVGVGTFATSVILTYFNWRVAFWTYSLAGVFFAVLFYFVLGKYYTNNADAVQTLRKVSLKNTFHPLILQLGLIALGTGIINWGLSAWMPSYWVNVQHVNMIKMGVFTVLPLSLMFVFMQVSGWVLDKYVVGREKYLIFVACLIVAVCLYLMISADNATSALVFLCVLYIAMAVVLTGINVLPLKYLPKDRIGAAIGFVNFGIMAGGVLAPTIMGRLLMIYSGSYIAVFYFSMLMILISGLTSLCLNPRKALLTAK
jgi:MFS family permease